MVATGGLGSRDFLRWKIEAVYVSRNGAVEKEKHAEEKNAGVNVMRLITVGMKTAIAILEVWVLFCFSFSN